MWNYTGDVNIEHGGVFFQSLDDDSIRAVAITPCSSAGGPDNLFLIEDGFIYVGDAERIASALTVCGYTLDVVPDIEGETYRINTGDGTFPVSSVAGLCLLVDAFMGSSGVEASRAEIVVRIGKVDTDFWDGRGWNPKPDYVLPGNAKLENFVRKNFLK